MAMAMRRRFALQLSQEHHHARTIISQRSLHTEPAAIAERLFQTAGIHGGDTLVQNEADSDLGRAIIKSARERGVTTINILSNKPGASERMELLKSMGGDVVVTEAYTNTWYMKRLINDLPKPSVALNCGEGSQVTAVAKLLKEGGTLWNFGKSMPEEVTYPGADRRPIKWEKLLKARKLTAKSLE